MTRPLISVLVLVLALVLGRRWSSRTDRPGPPRRSITSTSTASLSTSTGSSIRSVPLISVLVLVIVIGRTWSSRTDHPVPPAARLRVRAPLR